MKDKMNFLIEDYKRRLDAINDLLKQPTPKKMMESENLYWERIRTKASEYRTFIAELEKILPPSEEKKEEPSWNGNFTPSEIYKSERSGKELREKLTVRKFMLKKYPTNVYMDCPVPKEYWEVIQEYANEYLKSNQ